MSFAMLFLALSGSLGLITYEVTRSYLLDQRESTALRRTLADARVVSAGIRSADADVPTLLDALGTRSGSDALVYLGSQTYASSVSTNPSTLPVAFTEALQDHDVVKQRLRIHGDARLAVGTRLGPGFVYVEVFPLDELSHSLRIFGGVLLAAAGLLIVVGTGLGFGVSKRVLRPVTDVADAAARLASGQLDTRIARAPDRDLAVLAHSFNTMAVVLQQRIQRDAAFAADVSHELRSPLTTLVTAASVLDGDQDAFPERDRQAVRLIMTELARFERLVEDLIEIARADAGTPLDLQPLDVRVLVLEAVRTSPLGSLPIEIDESGRDYVVRGDKRRLERVLHNLIQNADRHGGGATRIGVMSGRDGVRIEVDDAGPGVPPAERERVFERFSRGHGVDGRRETTGSGIGLSLVAEHVRMHGGTVWVEDAPTGGARFVVRLPRDAA